MRKFLMSVLVFLAAVATASTASAVVDIDARYWFSTLDGDAMVSSGSIAGDRFDFVDDLGLDENKGFLEGRITLELGSHRLRYGFVPLKWDGSKSLDMDITFGGQTFTATTQVDSELKVNYHRLGYEYDIIDTLDNRLGVIFELKYLDGEASIASAGASEKESFRLPIPTVGVAAQVGLPFLFSVGGEVTGVTLGSNAYLVDAEAAVNLKPAPFVVISGGYRILKVHAERDLDRGDITVKGPFLNLRADF